MRIDAKVESPRQSMSWLHTWSSLILGWLLYAIFLTGTLSFFQNEITLWMKPELHQSVPAASQNQQVAVALKYLQNHYADAGSWTIQLPNSRQNTIVVMTRKQDEDPRARRGGNRIILDAQTGEVLQARETRGGAFLYRFHFELYGLPRTFARWIVGIATLFMLVAIISGIITHKKIFKDFFTFRSGKGQRSWLDAHNVTAVLALPFHIMITLSGLLLLLFTIMPWGVEHVYENRQQFLQDQRQILIQDRSERNQSRREKPAHKNIEAMPLTSLEPVLAYAQQQWRDNPVATITIISPNTNQAKIEVQALYSPSVAYRGVYPTLNFNGVTTGQPIIDQQKLLMPSVPMGIYNSFTVLHEARGVNLSLRWLLFFSGVLGTMMVATGLILWCVKRAPQQFKQGKKSFGYRLVEVMNIAAVIGLPIACAAYFYANRFISAQNENRAHLEIQVFFIVWLLSLIHAAFRLHKQAWLEQLVLATILFAFLPIINCLTSGQALWNSILQGQWVIATFDLAMWVFAVIFAFAFYKVKSHQPIQTKKNLKTNIVSTED